MATEVSIYKCPNCTGPLEFDPGTGRLRCRYCLGEFTAGELDAKTAKKEARAAAAFDQAGRSARTGRARPEEDWAADMRQYTCPDCGTVIAAEASTAVVRCPYCGNDGVVPGQFSGMRKPDYVIPFKIDRSAVADALKKHYKGKPFLPGGFKARNMIDKVQGVYVPFWMFDATVEAQVQFDGQIVYNPSDDKEKKTVKHHDSRRAGTVKFQNVPVDASKRMSDGLMDSILPYRYGEKKPFSMAYFAGFLAEKFDVSVDECAARCEERCVNTTINTLARDAAKVGKYDDVEVVNEQHRFVRDAVQYMLLPVWLVNTKWKGQDFLFAMNGQTGKFVGDLPISKPKYFASLFGMGAVLGTIAYIVVQALA